MTTMTAIKGRPAKVSPLRSDAPGTVTAMPSPTKLHHIHIFSDERYDEMVTFYLRMLNAEIIRVNPNGLTFMSYDDNDHRVVILKQPGGQHKPASPIGVSHVAFCYSSLGELIHIYKQAKEWGYMPMFRCENHGNSTSFYYSDPDGNRVEMMMDNYTPLETQDYKRYYQWSEEYGGKTEGYFNPDKMVELYESGVPDEILLDREEVRRLIREGRL